MARKKTREIRKSTTKDNSVQVIIETPRGCRNKYKYDEENGRLKLSKMLPEGMMFPYDFGFVPDTKADDGDPIDVLVLIEEPTFPGCEMECRLIGVIEAEQKEGDEERHRNDRIIAVAKQSLLYGEIKNFDELNRTVLKQIEAFFTNYQKVRNIEHKIIGVEGPDRAADLLKKSRQKKAA